MIIETIRRHAAARTDDRAIAFYASATAEPVWLSWRQMWASVEQLGTALSRHCRPADRVLLIFPQGIEFHLVQLACNYAGATPVPVPLPSAGGGEERLLGVVADSECAAIITLEAHRAELAGLGGGIPILSFEDLAAEPVAQIAPPYPAKPDDLAFIQYTSGSVSTPKGVLITHGNLDANMRMMQSGRWNCTRSFLSWVPHYHDMGLIGNFYLAMFDGGELNLTSAETFIRRPLSWLRLASRTGTTTTTVPHFALTLCARLAHTLKPGEIDLSRLLLIVNSSEPVDWDGLQEFEQAFAPFGLAPGTVVPHYGLAECTVMATYPTADRPRFLDVDRDGFADGFARPASVDAPSLRVVNCGRGQEDCAVAIVDPATQERLAPGRIGEVWITGSHVGQGFWNRPGESAQTFGQTITGDASGTRYVRSGDLGFVHDGDLYITGRMKDVIIVRGQNYFARDIEILAEQASPLVRTGRVVAIPMEHRGQETVGLLAEVAAKFDYRKDALDFVASFTGLLGEKLGLTPQVIVLVRRNSLPRTTSGKIRRRDAGEMYRRGELSALFEYESARFLAAGLDKAAYPGLEDAEALRRWLETIVLEQAGMAEIAHSEDLFTLGVDSLSMTNLLLEIEDLTGQSLLDEAFYAAPSINTLVERLAQEEGAATAPTGEDVPRPSSSRPAQDAPARRKRGWKKRLAHRLRDMGPVLGPLELPYGTGSRLLDRLTQSRSVLDRLSRPFGSDIDTLIDEQQIAEPDRVRREIVRSFTWVGWRERSLADPAAFARYTTMKGMEHLAAARGDGRGIILCLVTTRLKGLYKFIPELTARPFGVIANLAAERTAFYGLGPLAQVTGGKQSQTVPSARVAQIHKAHRILGEGGTVGIFMDAFDGTGGIALPFLGRKRPFRPGIAELAIDTNAVVIPVQQWLHDEGRITFEFMAPLQAQGSTREEKVLSLMVRQAEALEQMWRSNPGQMNDEAIRRQLALPKA